MNRLIVYQTFCLQIVSLSVDVINCLEGIRTLQMSGNITRSTKKQYIKKPWSAVSMAIGVNQCMNDRSALRRRKRRK